MKKLLLVFAAIIFIASGLYAQLSGTKNIPGDYSSIAEAVDSLNAQGVGSGGVTFNVAAGYTEVLTKRINLTATGTASDPIVFQKYGVGANPLLTAYVGVSTPGSATPDGMWALVGSDYVTIDGIDLYDPNTSNPATMEYGYGLFKSSTTNGCQYVTIKNCVITLNRINNASGSGPMPDGSTGILVINSIPTAATTALTITAASGSNSFNSFYKNTIQNANNGIALMGFAATTGVGPNPDPNTFFGDLGNDIGGNSSATGNIIKNFGGGGSTNPSAGIRANNQWSINISYNTINNNDGGGVNHATTLRGIFAQAGTSANANINYNDISIQCGATTSSAWAIDNGIGSTAAGNTININYNIIKVGYPTATTGVYTAINNSASAAVVNINFNEITQITGVALAGTGTHVMIETGSPTTVFTNNNIIRDLSRNGASGSWRGIKTTSPTNWTCNNNLIENISWTASASTGSFDAIYSFSSAVNVTANENIIRNISTPTTGTLNGIREYGVTGNKIFQNNQIYNFFTTSGGAGGATMNGIWTTVGNVDISNNKIYNLNSSGTTGGTAGTVYGIQITGGTTTQIYKNNIYNLSTTRTGSPTAPVLAGIHASSGSTTYIYNNFISDLRTPALSYSEAIRGISIANTTSGNTYGVYYNTVFINAVSTGSTFGTTGIFAHTSPTVDMRNNIIVNTSTPAGTGLTVAYRRSSTTLTTYSSLSNNNCFYAGTPGTNRLIFNDGTNSDQTMAAYKTRVAPRDAASFSENVPFINSTTPPYDLHISTTTPTQTESGGSAITSPITINDDFDGDLRATIPDVGADEFNGVGLDLSPPVIAYNLLGNSTSTTGRTFSNVVITDASGVETTTGLRPRVYYKRSTDANTFNDNTNATDGWKYVEATGTGGSPFSFDMDYSLLYTAGVPIGPGSIIQYFVVAQDIASPPNVGINSGVFNTAPSSVDLVAANFPITGAINSYMISAAISGTYNVGTGETYTTLTGAGGFFAFVNANVLTGNVVVNIVSNLVEDGTNALNQWSEEGTGGYTLTIQPDGTTERLISGSVAAGMIRFNGADRVTINGTSGKYLRFRNTNTSGPTFLFVNGAENNTITNCIIEGANTSVTSGTIVFGTSTGPVGNRNNTISNNDIRDRSDAAGVPANAIYSSGTIGLLNTTNTISGNNVFNWTGSGILLASTGLGDGWIISGNSFYQTASRTTTLTPISIGGGSGHMVSANNIGGSAPDRSGTPMTTTAAFTGISLTVGTTTPTSVQGNLISNVVSTATSACRGISVTSGNVNIGTIAGNIIGGGAAPYDTLNFAYDNDAIYLSGSGLFNVENNVIGNIRYFKASPGADRTCGIYAASTGKMHIKNNVIRDLSSNSTGTGYTYLPVGIYVSSTGNGHNIESNQIYNISHTNTGTAAYTSVGIYVASVASTPEVTKIHRNYIYNITAVGTGTGTSSPLIHGIYSASGNATYANNMVALGTGVENEVRIDGIRDVGSGTNNWYYNSVRIVGNTAGAVNRSYAFNRSGTTTVTLRNNIFSNVRTGGGGNVAIANTNAAATGWAAGASDYNIVNGATTALFQWLSTGSLTNLYDWQINSSGDANTIEDSPGFISDVNLHIDPVSSVPSNNAIPLVGIVDDDFDGDARSATNPDRGADEYTGVPPAAFALLTPNNGAINVPLNGDLTWETSQYAIAYDVYLDKVDATTLIKANHVGTSYAYENLDPSSTYYWKVVAKNGNGTTQATGSPWSFTTVALLPPNPPSDLTLSNITTDAMDLSWADNSLDEVGFNIYKSTDGLAYTLVDTVDANVTSYTGNASRSLSPNTRYWWRVTAYNANGESAPASANAFTLALTPGAPTLSNATQTSMLVKLDPAGNPAPTEFVVRVVYGSSTKYMNTAGVLVDNPVWATYTAFGGASGRTMTGLSPITSYTVDVKARNGNNVETVFGPSSTLQTLSYPTTLNEDFSTYTGFAPPPTGWNEGDQKDILDGGTFGTPSNGGWTVDGFGNVGTTGSARFNFYGTAAVDHDWIVTPNVSLTAKKASKLTFDIALTLWNTTTPTTMDPNDTMFVVVSTDGGNTFPRANVVAAFHAGTPISNTGQTISINLSAFGAQGNVRIGFYAKDLAGSGDKDFFIDNVRLEEIVEKDIEVMSVILSQPPYYVGSPITISAQIRNNGTEANPTSVPLTYKIGSAPDYQGDGEGQIFTPSWTDNVATVTFTVPYTPDTKGSFTIFVKSFYTGDQVTTNDVKSRTIKVLPYGALFEDWTDVNALARWKVVNNDGGSYTWRRATEKFLSTPASAGSDYESSTLRNDDWLITPKLSVVAGDSLTFWHSARSTTYPESLYVRLSTVGNDPSDPWVDLLRVYDPTTDWKYKAIDLTPWAGQNVWIAFVNRGLDRWTIYIDDITGPALYVPFYDLAFTKFYQSSGLPTPKVDRISDNEVWMMNETISDEKPIANLPDKGITELRESEISKTIVYPSNALQSLDKKLNPINVKAEIANKGRNSVAYTLDWSVSGVAQPTYSGPTVDSGQVHIADLTFNPTTRGTFLTTGSITVAGDENPDNNSNYFRMRVYPDAFTRTIYDRGDNVVDTWVGWGSPTRPMKAGVRFTAPQTMRLAGVDFICRTEAVVSGNIIVTVRGASDSLTGPGPVLYSKIYSATDYFAGAGDYITFPFDDNAPVIAGGSDYWITIKMPAGVLYPGAVHNTGFTTGRSFYEGAVDLDTTKWYPLVITTERAWIMRSYSVPPPNSISGVKFNDLNGNGQKDEGEPGLEGWYINLNGPVNDVKITGPDGSYFFGDLPDGEYLITEDQQVGWIQTMPPAPGSYTVVVSGGMNVTDKNFGNYKLGKISGYKWEDINGNGVWDNGEPTVANWPIVLNGPVSGNTVTNENGLYVFENLLVGEYTISENILNGWYSTYPTPASHTVNILSGTEIAGQVGVTGVPNFGNTRFGTVYGMKFWDRNNNGVKDPGEVGLANWEIILTGENTPARSTFTNAEGNFIFQNVKPDLYTLTEVVKNGWTNTVSPAPFSVISGQVVTDKLFGNFRNVDATKYRSFVPEDLVALDSKGKVPKAVKRKPVGAYWEFMIINPREYPLTLINIQFKNDVKNIVSAGGFSVTGTKKDFVLQDSVLAPGDTIIVKGYSTKGKPQEIKKLWYGPKATVPATGIKPVYQYLELPLPSWRNMIDEIFAQGGFQDDGGGLLVGQKGDPKKIGWVFITKPGDVVKSLYDKGIHNAGPKFFRKFDNGKQFLKEQKSLSPTKQNNKLFAEIVAAKLAIAASKLGKIPAGYPDLIYIDDEVVEHPFNEMTIEEIVDSISNAMNTFEGDSADYYRVIRKLNTAFAGPIDTVNFGLVPPGVVLKGVRALAEIPYLFANPEGKVSRIEPKPIVYQEEVPSVFELSQNYPNPFNPTTVIEFTLPEDAIVTLKVYNILGQEVATLIDNEIYTEGLNDIEFDAGKLSSGVYFYRLTAETLGDTPMKYSQVKKMVLMK